MSKIIEKYSQLYGSPFLSGIMMGVNAIKDSALYVDGPDCVFYKADMLFKTHDMCSNLKTPSIDTRLYFSGVMPNKMIRGYDDKIGRKLGFIEDNPKFNLGVVTCMPVTGLLAIHYANIFSDFTKDFLFVPSFTDKFWIDGYSIFLKELAKKIDIDTTKEKQEKHISIIGFLFDRNEGDVIGNIEEIKRILSLLGINVDCIWLDGNNYSDLKNVEISKLLVSFPYGEMATRILSKRLGVNFINSSIPFGLAGIIDFIEKIGEKLGIDANLVKSIINKEIKEIKSKMDILDEKVFLNKNYIYAGDPFLESYIKDIGELLGMNHIKTYAYNGTKLAEKKDLGTIGIDFVIGNSEFNHEKYPKFEFGFPSYNTHFLLNRPYMGFRGFLFFIERMYNELVSLDKLN
ncbi:hypothetical protein COW68_01805 [Candidatus Gracilibacteria bacterium CG18_big_fil_WC_8_21_14_2_50_38_16]|nr:MAG: hypothetical protein COW68_01805 [Candidatus Gracilibacteria bacterium CG18_big_fil_WC_8_21_14_2_50_38_16]